MNLELEVYREGSKKTPRYLIAVVWSEFVTREISEIREGSLKSSLLLMITIEKSLSCTVLEWEKIRYLVFAG